MLVFYKYGFLTIILLLKLFIIKLNEMKVRNLHTYTPGAVPDKSLLDYGEIAINHSEGEEKIFIKNSGDEVVGFDRISKEDYYTKTEVDDKLKDINISGGTGGDVDLKGYAKESWVKEQGYVTQTWVEGQKYLKEHQDISGLASKEEVSEDLKNLKSEILGGAGEDYDTLKEIEEWINEHEDVYEGLIATLGTKATKEEIADMATKTFVGGEVDKLTEELNKKCNVVVCDNQYEFDQILTKDNNTIYLIKGDQDQWFSKEDGDELYDFYGDLRERVSHLERLVGLNVDDPQDEVDVND